MKKTITFLALPLMLLLLVACGKSKVPSNELSKEREVVLAGFIPDTSVTLPPKAIYDTLVYMTPTWGQANYYASKRGDAALWFIVGLLSAALTVLYLYGAHANHQVKWMFWAKWKELAKGTATLALLGWTLWAFKHNASDIKENNKVEIKKSHYDFLMQRDGSTQAYWDSLEAGCHLRFGPYNCFKK